MTNITQAAAKRAAAAETELRAALLEERRGYVARGLTARVEAVDEQIAHLSGATTNAEHQGDPVGAGPEGAGGTSKGSGNGDKEPSPPKGRGTAKDAVPPVSPPATATPPATPEG